MTLELSRDGRQWSAYACYGAYNGDEKKKRFLDKVASGTWGLVGVFLDDVSDEYMMRACKLFIFITF
ncbi:hypothetical protein ACJX0J_032929, partial [Zea mays]